MSSNYKYFGTDGIRGVANGKVLNPDVVVRIAQATGQAIADLPQGVGLSHLAEQHRGQLGPSK